MKHSERGPYLWESYINPTGGILLPCVLVRLLQKASPCRRSLLPTGNHPNLLRIKKVSPCLRIAVKSPLTKPHTVEIAPKQRGPKGYFHGSRKEFLESQLPAYTADKKGSRQSFWHKFWTAWWEHYPWKLSDNEEPPTDPVKLKELV